MRLLLSITAFLSSSVVAAAGMTPTYHPRDFCLIGAEAGLPTRPFNYRTGGCSSNYVDISTKPGKGGMVNNIAFYSMSREDAIDKLMRVSLILNVNNPADTAASREILIKAATITARRILGVEPAGMAAAIRAGNSSAWTGLNWRTEVVYRNWPTGIGHDISVRFMPTGSDIHQQ